MNLHAVVGPLVGAVNPNQIIAVQVSVGTTEAADGSQQPAYATPGSITASIGGTFTASASGTTLDVTAVLTGSLQSGDVVSGTDGTNSLPAGCFIASQLTGTAGGVGTYELSAAPASGTLNPCEVTSASTTLNVGAIAQGVVQAGQSLTDVPTALLAGTLVTGQLSGITGGPGLYLINQQQTVASETMTTSMTLVAQVQAMTGGDLRHMDMLNLQGSHRTLYVNAPLRGAVRVSLKGGDIVTLPDGSVWLVNQVMEPFFGTAGFQKVVITLQDGS